MYVLDTNTLIYFFKGVGGVAYNLLRVPPREIGIPSIVLYELQVGIAKSNLPKKRITLIWYSGVFCFTRRIIPLGRCR